MGMKRIELSPLALEASFLPLETFPNPSGRSWTCVKNRSTVGPVSVLAQTDMHPAGIEPAASCLSDKRTTSVPRVLFSTEVSSVFTKAGASHQRVPARLFHMLNASDGSRTHFHWLRTNDDYRYTTEALCSRWDLHPWRNIESVPWLLLHYESACIRAELNHRSLACQASATPLRYECICHWQGLNLWHTDLQSVTHPNWVTVTDSQGRSWTADSGSWVRCTRPLYYLRTWGYQDSNLGSKIPDLRG